MAMFVHLTAERNINAILRNGISRMRKPSNRPQGIFAMPVTRNFYVSHQWLRELKRRSDNTIVAVYFRIPNEETVWVGHYNQAHRQMTAAEAGALMSTTENREGYEVIVPRRIGKDEIHRIKNLRQVTGGVTQVHSVFENRNRSFAEEQVHLPIGQRARIRRIKLIRKICDFRPSPRIKVKHSFGDSLRVWRKLNDPGHESDWRNK